MYSLIRKNLDPRNEDKGLIPMDLVSSPNSFVLKRKPFLLHLNDFSPSNSGGFAEVMSLPFTISQYTLYIMANIKMYVSTIRCVIPHVVHTPQTCVYSQPVRQASILTLWQ